MTLTTEEMLSEQFDLLGHGLVEGFTEVRTFTPPTQDFCETKEELIQCVKQYNEQDKDVYIGVNPRKVKSGTAKDVEFVTCIVLDIDPVRPKNAASTPEQHEASLKLAHRIREAFVAVETNKARGFVADSGSGAHLYVPIAPIKIENLERLTESLKLWMDTIREAYATKDLKIDAIFDVPRVIRAWGSHNHRSNRPCIPVSKTDGFERWNHTFSQATKTNANKPSTPVEVVNDRFNQLVKYNKRLAQIVEGNVSYPSRSECDFEFISILAKAQFTVEEIKELVLKNPHGRQKECKESDIKRIVSKSFKDDRPNSYSLRNNSDDYFAGLEQRTMGVRTGITALDELTSGLKGGKLYVYAARPNVGKTTLITQILLNIAEQGKTCLYFPTEVGSDPIFDKIVSQKTQVNLGKFQNGTFTPADKEIIKASRALLSNLPIIVIEDFGLTIAKIEEGIKQYAPDIVAIDFFQALKWNDPNSVGEKNEAVRRLKQVAMDLNKPIIIASQLNRSDGKLDLKQLKGAGALEELGDVITYISVGNSSEYPVPYDLNVLKSKYSATGLVNLYFYRTISLFTEKNYGRNHSDIGKDLDSKPTTPARSSGSAT